MRSARGFTLLETLVALVIALIALSGLYVAIGQSLRAAREAVQWDRAIAHAQSRLAEITNPAAMLGIHTGTEADGFAWQTEVSLAGQSPARRDQRGGMWAAGTGLYRIDVTISWKDHHDFTLHSAELGPLGGS